MFGLKVARRDQAAYVAIGPVLANVEISFEIGLRPESRSKLLWADYKAEAKVLHAQCEVDVL